MSRSTWRTVSTERSRAASYIGRVMPASSAADTANVSASKPSSQAGCRNAISTPTADGTTISMTLWRLQT